jgi:hypothetical protein
MIMKKMKMFKKLLLGTVIGATLLAGCGSADAASGNSSYAVSNATAGDYYGGDYSYAQEEAAYDMEYEYGFDSYDVAEAPKEADTGSTASSPRTVDTIRKLITTAYVDVETKEFDKLYDDIDNYVKGAGGYLESINTYNGSRYHGEVVERHANLTVRIPADKLDAFLEEIGNAGNITNRTQNVEDITLTYVDLEAHKKTLQDEQDRLEEFLRNAETIEDMIYIEDRLANIRYQLESMESQLRTYDNKVNYSTVYLTIDEVVEYTPVVYEEPTTLERMKEGFLESVEDLTDWCKNFAVWFVSNFIFLIIWGIIIFIIVKWILYMASDKRAAKKAAKLAQKQKAQYEAYQNTMNGQAPVQNAAPSQNAGPAQDAAPSQPAAHPGNKENK